MWVIVNIQTVRICRLIVFLLQTLLLLRSPQTLLNIWGVDRENVWILQNWVFGVPSRGASVATIRTNKHIRFHIISFFFFVRRTKIKTPGIPRRPQRWHLTKVEGKHWCHSVKGPNTTFLWCRLRVRQSNVFIFIGGCFRARDGAVAKTHSATVWLLIGRSFPAASPRGLLWIEPWFLVITAIKEDLW